MGRRESISLHLLFPGWSLKVVSDGSPEEGFTFVLSSEQTLFVSKSAYRAFKAECSDKQKQQERVFLHICQSRLTRGTNGDCLLHDCHERCRQPCTCV